MQHLLRLLERMQVTNMRDISNVDIPLVMEDANLLSSLNSIADFLGDERNPKAKGDALAYAKGELLKRPSIDGERLQSDLRLKAISVVYRFSYFAKCLIPDIQAGKYDSESKPEGTKKPLSSSRLFKKMRALGVEDDSGDGYGYERIDYYLNAVWMNSGIAIDEIHQFTAAMVVWIEARHEWRKASKIMELCRRSKILGNWLSPEDAMAKAEADVKEDRELNKEIDGL